MALAEKVRALTGSASEIVTIPYDQAYEAGFEDMPRRVPDISQDPARWSATSRRSSSTRSSTRVDRPLPTTSQ